MIESFEHGTNLMGHHISEILTDERTETAFTGTLEDITDPRGRRASRAGTLYIGRDGYILQHTTWLGHQCIYFLIVDSLGAVAGYIHPAPGNMHRDGKHMDYITGNHKYSFTIDEELKESERIYESLAEELTEDLSDPSYYV